MLTINKKYNKIEKTIKLEEINVDISIFLEDTKLNIRTAVIIDTEKGYIFEKDKLEGFYYVVGGRIKINETSKKAAKREINEELGIKIKNINLKAIVESFYVYDNKKYHEICFYYKHKINGSINLPENYFVFNKEEIKKENIQPKIIYEIINSENDEIKHLMINE
jgi:ADP-ribose pyrophosphatase YjhB (NUDIX family)